VLEVAVAPDTTFEPWARKCSTCSRRCPRCPSPFRRDGVAELRTGYAQPRV